MPRISPRDMAQAFRLHPLLGKLMGVCRTVEASKRELRWLEDEVLRLNERDSFRLLQKYRIPFHPPPTDVMELGLPKGKWEKFLLQKFVDERSKGTPLQLVVENQPFGHLNMHVRSGVFIPRWETEEWTLALANRLRRLTPSRQSFTLVDLCTGSGCIPLLLKDYVSANIDKGLYPKYGKQNTTARFIGIEKSATAIDVARINLKHTQSSDRKFPDGTIYFIHDDIHYLPPASFQGRVDIITCNPPYIPLSSRPTLDRSVSKYEPSEALFVPSKYGDDYYHTLRAIANRWETPAVVMEVGDLEQAERVKSLFELDEQWKSSIWLDSAGRGRVVVAVKSEKWAALLPQPDYSIPLDLSPFPRREPPRKGLPGSILSTFRRPRLVVPTVPTPRAKKDSEKADIEDKQMSFVDRMLDKLRLSVKEDEKTGFIKYLEDLKKISK